jgi:hypothetical protein
MTALLDSILAKHAAPVHPGTGTDQSVHGGGVKRVTVGRGVADQPRPPRRLESSEVDWDSSSPPFPVHITWRNEKASGLLGTTPAWGVQVAGQADPVLGFRGMTRIEELIEGVGPQNPKWRSRGTVMIGEAERGTSFTRHPDEVFDTRAVPSWGTGDYRDQLFAVEVAVDLRGLSGVTLREPVDAEGWTPPSRDFKEGEWQGLVVDADRGLGLSITEEIPLSRIAAIRVLKGYDEYLSDLKAIGPRPAQPRGPNEPDYTRWVRQKYGPYPSKAPAALKREFQADLKAWRSYWDISTTYRGKVREISDRYQGSGWVEYRGPEAHRFIASRMGKAGDPANPQSWDPNGVVVFRAISEAAKSEPYGVLKRAILAKHGDGSHDEKSHGNWAHGSRPEYTRGQSIEEHSRADDAWKHQVRRALAEGQLTNDQARELGYFGTGHDQSTQGLNWQPLPERLYHVTTAASAVRQHGLLSRAELGQARGAGLGGGESDTVSFTADPSVAGQIYRTMVEAQQVAAGDITLDDLIEQARTGAGAERPFLQPLLDGMYGGKMPEWFEHHRQGIEVKQLYGFPKTPEEFAERHGEGWTPRDPWPARKPNLYSSFQRPLSSTRSRELTFEFYKNFLAYRAFAGGPDDPLFFSSDVDALASFAPSEIQVLEVRPRPGTQGYQMGALGEWRTMSGVFDLVEDVTKRFRVAALVGKHYPGGHDHDQSRHGRRGPGTPTPSSPRPREPHLPDLKRFAQPWGDPRGHSPQIASSTAEGIANVWQRMQADPRFADAEAEWSQMSTDPVWDKETLDWAENLSSSFNAHAEFIYGPDWWGDVVDDSTVNPDALTSVFDGDAPHRKFFRQGDEYLPDDLVVDAQEALDSQILVGSTGFEQDRTGTGGEDVRWVVDAIDPETGMVRLRTVNPPLGGLLGSQAMTTDPREDQYFPLSPEVADTSGRLSLTGPRFSPWVSPDTLFAIPSTPDGFSFEVLAPEVYDTWEESLSNLSFDWDSFVGEHSQSPLDVASFSEEIYPEEPKATRDVLVVNDSYNGTGISIADPDDFSEAPVLFRDLWANTSADDHPWALAMQHAVAEEFGVSEYTIRAGIRDESALEEAAAITERFGTSLRVWARAVYGESQSWLAEQGWDWVPVVRGMAVERSWLDEADWTGGGFGDTLYLTDLDWTAISGGDLNPLSSWSVDAATGIAFSHHGGGLGDPVGVLLKGWVPASQVWGVSLRGNGASKEYELILLGGEDSFEGWASVYSISTARGIIFDHLFS